MRSSSSERPSAAPLRRLLPLLAVAAACATAEPGHRLLPTLPADEVGRSLDVLGGVDPDARFGGEYGLVVREWTDSLEVRWITPAGGPGVLRLRSGDVVHQVVETPDGRAHAVRLPRPGDRRVRLEYGSLGDPDGLHVTEVRLGEPRRPGGRFEEVDSVFAVGDVHGEYDTLRRLLTNAGVIDGSGRWSGGRAHLVLLGDLFDRGPDVTRTLWFLYRLEDEARASGGRVHVVLGNHETMVLTGDLRYVSPREQTLARLHGTSYPDLFDVRRTVLGRWLASKPGLLRIDDALFAHGGVSEPYLGYSVEEFNDTLSAFMGEELFRRWGDTTFVPALDSASYTRRLRFFHGEESVFWFRGYVTSDTADALLDRVLERHDSRVHVVAHTPVETIAPRYGGRLLPVDLERPASELLFLERLGGTLRAYRYGLEGGPVRLTPTP